MSNIISRKIILASASPRRVQILQQMGVDCHVMPANIDESRLGKESPTEYVLRLAAQKAQAVAALNEAQKLNLPILAADTTVALYDTIFGKPENDADAINMLKILSNTTHQVHTAVAIFYKNQLFTEINSTQVSMIALTDAMINNYIKMREHTDKAGSYAIQGLAGSWIEKIEGSYTGVMGLPVFETAQLLQKIVLNRIG
jgi:septum formation protein